MSLKALLVLAPFLHVLYVESLIDLAVQLVQVHLIDLVLELQIPGIQLLDRFIVERRLLRLAQTQSFPCPIEYFLGKLKLSENLPELPLQPFLPNILSAAPPLTEGAVIVNVTALRNLGGDRAAALGSLQKPRLGKVMGSFPTVVFDADHRPIGPVSNILLHSQVRKYPELISRT